MAFSAIAPPKNVAMNNPIDSLHLIAKETRRALPQLRGADLPLLVSLDVLLEECNVTRASARLHISQPALSAQLSRLRLLFGDPLLLTSENGRGLVPSQFAMDLHRRLKPALATLSSALRLDADTFEPHTTSRTFTIAATNTAAAMVLPALVAKVLETGNRALKLVTVEPDFAKLPGQLERGEVDLCVSPACLLPSNLSVDALLTTRHVMAQRSGHPRGRGPVDIDEYCRDLDHVTVSRDGVLHGYIDEQLYREGHSRHVAFAVRDYSYVAELLATSDLVCTLPEALSRSLPAGIETAPIVFPLSSYSLCMAWHARSDEDVGLLWLRDTVKAMVGDDAGT
jgi:DNA-binding transcriptional LysR family regulator